MKASSVPKFRCHLRRLVVKTRSTGVFNAKRCTPNQYHLADEIRTIQGGHTYVIDIAKLMDHEQAFVFGDIIRTIYEMFAELTETLNYLKKC